MRDEERRVRAPMQQTSRRVGINNMAEPITRDQLAASAPIDYPMVQEALRTAPAMWTDQGQQQVFTMWATLARKWADAMIAELTNNPAQ